jgi:hypothetical protein
MKRKWLLLVLTLCFFLPNFTENHFVNAQAPSSSCYSDSGSSISWVITEPTNQTYSTPNLNLSVTGETFMATLTNISYSIDGKQRVFLHMTYEKTDDDPITQVRRGYAQLPPLSDGVYKITVYIDGWAGFPSKTIPTQKTVINVKINTANNFGSNDNSENPTPNKQSYEATKEINNPTHGKDITIWSPTNRTYKTNEAIKLEATSINVDYHLHGASYKLDDNFYVLYNQEKQSQTWDSAFGTLFGCVTLPKLSEGPHKLTVHLQIVYVPPIGDFVDEVTVYFSVGNNKPNITLHSLDDAVFNQSSVPLNFTVNKPTSWMAYCLDNGTQTTIAGNTTLTVASGNHTIIVYANDTDGNMGQSEMTHFMVQLPATEELKTEDATFLVAVGLVNVAIATTVLVAKRKRKT